VTSDPPRIHLSFSRAETEALLEAIGAEPEGVLGDLRARLLVARLRAERVPEVSWPEELQRYV